MTAFQSLYGLLDYLKTGHYDEKLGGLDCPTTNQRFYRLDHGQLIDITTLFQRKQVEK